MLLGSRPVVGERVRRARAPVRPTPGRARCSPSTVPSSCEQRRSGPSPRAVAARPPPAIGDARGVDADERVRRAAEGAPQLAERLVVRRAGGPLAHPVEDLRVGGAVLPPGAGRRRAGRPRRSSARESPPPAPKQATSRVARLVGSRWSSTQSTPLVMVSTSLDGARRRSRVPASSGTWSTTRSSRPSAPVAHGDADQVGEHRLGHRGAEEAVVGAESLGVPLVHDAARAASTSREVPWVNAFHSARSNIRPAPAISTSRSRDSRGSGVEPPAGTVRNDCCERAVGRVLGVDETESRQPGRVVSVPASVDARTVGEQPLGVLLLRRLHHLDDRAGLDDAGRR